MSKVSHKTIHNLAHSHGDQCPECQASPEDGLRIDPDGSYHGVFSAEQIMDLLPWPASSAVAGELDDCLARFKAGEVSGDVVAAVARALLLCLEHERGERVDGARERLIEQGRIGHIRSMCAQFSSESDRPDGRGLSNRGWLAQGVINILDGNIDAQIIDEAGLPTSVVDGEWVDPWTEQRADGK